MHFNQLTPAEAERLALLAEELGEATQAIGKILRHGYESTNPMQANSPTNRETLEKELGHVRHAMIRLCEAGDLSKANVHEFSNLKSMSIDRWLHHQTPNV